MTSAPMAPVKARIALALGVSLQARPDVVRAMLEGHEKDGATYWFQLLLSMGIATLGLVLNSTGVVIGAMLISPLMGPLVAFGMGLAVGSPLLVLRSAVRTAASISVVIGSAALLTLMLPFHEVTPEIAARTSPTILDLLVAVGCALAAAFTTVRPGSETASSAAGTAIGIALVPPLCVTGFGVGARLPDVAGGAALLFTTNLCAILFVTAGFFVALGFDGVDATVLEEQAGTAGRPTGRAVRRLRVLFGSKYGPVVRIAMPLAFLAAVAVPLANALGGVSREVRVRTAIRRAIDALPAGEQAVRSAISVTGDLITVRLVMVAKPERARALEEQIKLQVAAVSGAVPSVEVLALPNLAAMEETASRLIAHTDAPAPAGQGPPPATAVHERVASILAASWPPAAGELLAWRLGWTEGVPVVEIDHLGKPLDDVGEALLARLFGDALDRPPVVRTSALPATEVVAAPEGQLDWLAAYLGAIRAARRIPGLRVCVEVPGMPARRRGRPAPGDILGDFVRGSMRAPGFERATIRTGDRLAFRVAKADCSEPAPPPPSR